MRIAFVGNDDFSMWHFRRVLITRLLESGNEVIVIVPPGNYVEKIRSLGVECRTIPMKRFFSPVSDAVVFLKLISILHSVKPRLLHTMTIKPNIFATLAGAICRIPHRVALVSGVGSVFASDATSITSKIARQLLRFSFRFVERVWFQNPDDQRLFIEKGLIDESRTVVIAGSGVDPQYFSDTGVPDMAQTRNKFKREHSIPEMKHYVVMIAARRIWSKGVGEFLDAAERAHGSHPDTHFILLAPPEYDDSDCVPDEYVVARDKKNLTLISDFCHDIRPLLSLATIFVLPSYYREGIPRVVLEAMSFSKPIVTTDSVGCRETVVPGLNGMLVAPRNGEELYRAIDTLLNDAVQREKFGVESRKRVLEVFADDRIVEGVFTRLYPPLTNHTSTKISQH